MRGYINICKHGMEAGMICINQKCQKHPFVCQQQALCEKCLQQHSACRLQAWEETEVSILKSIVRGSLLLRVLTMFAIILNWISCKIKSLECHLKSYTEPIQRDMIMKYVKKLRRHEKTTNNILSNKLAWVIIGLMLFLCLRIMLQRQFNRNSTFITTNFNDSINISNSSKLEHLPEPSQQIVLPVQDTVQLEGLQIPTRPILEIESLITNETALISSFFAKNITRMQLIYRASQHKFSTQSFHYNCDGRQNMLLIAINEFGRIFGAFSPIPFASSLGFEHTRDSSGQTFLFSISYRQKLPILFNQRPNALYNDADWGPSYGKGCDLRIADRADQNRYSYSSFPQSFYNPQQKDANIARYRLTGSISNQGFKLKEWEIFQLEFQN